MNMKQNFFSLLSSTFDDNNFWVGRKKEKKSILREEFNSHSFSFLLSSRILLSYAGFIIIGYFSFIFSPSRYTSNHVLSLTANHLLTLAPCIVTYILPTLVTHMKTDIRHSSNKQTTVNNKRMKEFCDFIRLATSSSLFSCFSTTCQNPLNFESHRKMTWMTCEGSNIFIESNMMMSMWYLVVGPTQSQHQYHLWWYKRQYLSIHWTSHRWCRVTCILFFTTKRLFDRYFYFI